MNANNEKLQRSYNELVEYKLVLNKVWLSFLLWPSDNHSSIIIFRYNMEKLGLLMVFRHVMIGFEGVSCV